MTPEQKADLSQRLDEWIKAGMMDKDLKEVILKKLEEYEPTTI